MAARAAFVNHPPAQPSGLSEARKSVTKVGESLRVVSMDPKGKRMLANAFKQHRLSLGASQAQLAEALGVDVMTISRWERGVHAVPASVARLIERMKPGDVVRFARSSKKEGR